MANAATPTPVSRSNGFTRPSMALDPMARGMGKVRTSGDGEVQYPHAGGEAGVELRAKNQYSVSLREKK